MNLLRAAAATSSSCALLMLSCCDWVENCVSTSMESLVVPIGAACPAEDQAVDQLRSAAAFGQIVSARFLQARLQRTQYVVCWYRRVPTSAEDRRFWSDFCSTAPSRAELLGQPGVSPRSMSCDDSGPLYGHAITVDTDEYGSALSDPECPSTYDPPENVPAFPVVLSGFVGKDVYPAYVRCEYDTVEKGVCLNPRIF